ncbi:hypothetical protein AVEN_64319-1 [Araneus ventricosus]|uniref:Uncharacterized protein n=1 Tax=Araneus ventricosus TaxID=182803 RepID=A0A4Y2PID3_ARAVE|nr:hypothetical protein AVEN_64319-1 [Araneus ventricosus]
MWLLTLVKATWTFDDISLTSLIYEGGLPSELSFSRNFPTFAFLLEQKQEIILQPGRSLTSEQIANCLFVTRGGASGRTGGDQVPPVGDAVPPSSEKTFYPFHATGYSTTR